ncbi:unnamed protein product, partial [Sphenostylis stenocarpa]
RRLGGQDGGLVSHPSRDGSLVHRDGGLDVRLNQDGGLVDRDDGLVFACVETAV